jgi:hypothetical protein
MQNVFNVINSSDRESFPSLNQNRIKMLKLRLCRVLKLVLNQFLIVLSAIIKGSTYIRNLKFCTTPLTSRRVILKRYWFSRIIQDYIIVKVVVAPSGNL